MNWLLFLHIIGATIWTGGHLILAIRYLPQALKTNDITELQKFEDKFEKIGIPALLIQIITGFWMASNWLPVSDWFSFENSLKRAVFVKILLLVATALLAVDARLRIIPKLTPQNLRPLAWHIIPVTIISVIFVLIGVSFRSGGI